MPARGPAFRLLPRIDHENRFFWTSGADGRLRFLRCQDCGDLRAPARPRSARSACPGTWRPRWSAAGPPWWPHTCNVQQWIPGSEPYLIGLVAIDEQESVRLTTNLVDVELDDVQDGMAVEVVFEQNDDVYLPLFRPVDPGGAGS